MNDSNEMKTIREEILKNKEFFLLNFINDVPDEEDLIIPEEKIFRLDTMEHEE